LKYIPSKVALLFEKNMNDAIKRRDAKMVRLTSETYKRGNYSEKVTVYKGKESVERRIYDL